MIKLFAVMMGGRADGCNIELHDVVFTTGQSLAESYPNLINKWFGNKKRLHIDSSIELQQVDGHNITLRKDKPAHDIKIFFVNFGAYIPQHFGEIHEIGFYVGASKSEVLARAKQDLCLDMSEQHCDDNIDIDDIISLDKVDQYYIHLLAADTILTMNIESYYRKIILPENAGVT